MATFPKGRVITSHPVTPTPDTRANILLSSMIGEADATRRDIALIQSVIGEITTTGVQNATIGISEESGKKYITLEGGCIVTPTGIVPGPTVLKVEVLETNQNLLLLLTLANYSTRTRREFPSVEGLNIRMWDHHQKYQTNLRLVKESDTDVERGMVTVPTLFDKDGMDYPIYDDGVGGREIKEPQNLELESTERYESGAEITVFLGTLKGDISVPGEVNRKYVNITAPRWNVRSGTLIVPKRHDLLTLDKNTAKYAEIYVEDENKTYRVTDPSKIGSYEAVKPVGGVDDRIVIRTRVRDIKRPSYLKISYDVEVLREEEATNPQYVVSGKTELGKVLRESDRDVNKPAYMAEEGEEIYVLTRDGLKKVSLLLGKDGKVEVQVSGKTYRATNVSTSISGDDGNIIITKKED